MVYFYCFCVNNRVQLPQHLELPLLQAVELELLLLLLLAHLPQLLIWKRQEVEMQALPTVMLSLPLSTRDLTLLKVKLVKDHYYSVF